MTEPTGTEAVEQPYQEPDAPEEALEAEGTEVVEEDNVQLDTEGMGDEEEPA